METCKILTLHGSETEGKKPQGITMWPDSSLPLILSKKIPAFSAAGRLS
jgi:hypothetical protein